MQAFFIAKAFLLLKDNNKTGTQCEYLFMPTCHGGAFGNAVFQYGSIRLGATQGRE